MNFDSLLENEIIETSKWVYEYLKSNLKNQQIQIYKPMPSPIDKIQNRWRYRIIVKGNMTEEINQILNSCLKEIYEKDLKNTRVSIDLNPNNMI